MRSYQRSKALANQRLQRTRSARCSVRSIAPAPLSRYPLARRSDRVVEYGEMTSCPRCSGYMVGCRSRKAMPMGSESALAANLVLRPSDLVFFVDETGHEGYADPGHPVFGYGGCAVMGSDYEALIRTPWRSLKSLHFGALDSRLHAADLSLGEAQVAAFVEFFHRPFARFAAVTKVSTCRQPPLGAYQLAAGALLERARVLAERYPADRLVFVFEASQRLDPLADRFFPVRRFNLKQGDSSIEIPAVWTRMSKEPSEAGLEVADFIIHTAGAQVRLRERGGTLAGWRRDFEAIFNVDPKLVSYIEVVSARLADRQPAAGNSDRSLAPG